MRGGVELDLEGLKPLRLSGWRNNNPHTHTYFPRSTSGSSFDGPCNPRREQGVGWIGGEANCPNPWPLIARVLCLGRALCFPCS
jgi:hypothetical protein